MYAVVKTGGKQVRMSPGDSIRIEKLAGDVGEEISFDQVLLVSGDGNARVGTPVVEEASVRGIIVSQGRGKKITVFKMKRRKGYRRKAGHRQDYTEVKVESIDG